MHLKRLVPIKTTAILLISLFHSAQVSADTVKPKFVGVPGDDALVEFSNSRSRVQAGEETFLFGMNGNFRHRVSDHEKGFLLSHDSYDITAEYANETLRNLMAPVIKIMGLSETKAVVAESGELIELDGMEPILESLEDAIASLAEELPENVREKYFARMNAIINEQAFFESVQDDWSYQVAMWNGAELEKGFYYEGEFSESVKEFGGIDLPFEATYEYLGKVPCNTSDADLSCVELAFTSALPSQVSDQITNNVQKRAGIPTPEGFVMGVETTYNLIAESENLRTHSYSATRSVKTIADDGSAWIEDIEVKRYDFNYR